MTLAEFLAMPEKKPASEYIDGQIIQKPIPQSQHSIIQKQSVIVIGAGQIFDVIDEPSAILPVPEFAKSIKLTIADIFG
jgi:hypothetical protein